jgi:hypothetical protein
MRHPAIKHWARRQGWSQHDEPDFDTFSVTQQYRMALSTPEDRMQALNDIDAALAAEDGTTLRAKSDLMRLRQEMSRTHEALLKAGR